MPAHPHAPFPPSPEMIPVPEEIEDMEFPEEQEEQQAVVLHPQSKLFPSRPRKKIFSPDRPRRKNQAPPRSMRHKRNVSSRCQRQTPKTKDGMRCTKASWASPVSY